MNGLATRRALRATAHTDCSCMGCKMAAAAADQAADLQRARAALSDAHTRRLLAAQAERIDAEDAARGVCCDGACAQGRLCPQRRAAGLDDEPSHWRDILAALLYTAVALIAVGAMLVFVSQAAAAELHATVHGVSWHGHANRSFDGQRQNGENVGAGLRWQIAPAVGVQAGGYRNSHDRDSVYLLADWTPWQAGAWRAGVFAGAASNYVDWAQITRSACGIEKHGRHARPVFCERVDVHTKVQAAAGALLRWQGERLSVTVRGVPGVKDHGGVVSVEAGWRL